MIFHIPYIFSHHVVDSVYRRRINQANPREFKVGKSLMMFVSSIDLKYHIMIDND